jgi:hypothetical protein
MSETVRVPQHHPKHPHSLEDRPFLTCLKDITFRAENTADNKRKNTAS